MKLRVATWVLVAAPLAVLVAVGTPSCSNASKSPEGLAAGCSINSDCNNPLVCAFSLCHEQCAASRDCSAGERCIETNGVGVCELPGESSCAMGKACTGALQCGPDQQCRAPCTSANVSTACAQQQVCSGGLCYDPSELDGTSGSEGGSSSGSEAGSSSGSGGDGSADGPVVEAGPLGYVPSNLGTVNIADGGIPDAGADAAPPAIIGADGGLDWSNAVDVSIMKACSAACLGPGITITQSGMSPATLYVVKTLTVASGQTLTLNGPNPVIIASLGDVDIQGSVNVNGVYAGFYPGAGGWPPAGMNSAAPAGTGRRGERPERHVPDERWRRRLVLRHRRQGGRHGAHSAGREHLWQRAEHTPPRRVGRRIRGEHELFELQRRGHPDLVRDEHHVRGVGFINAGGAGALGGGASRAGRSSSKPPR